MSVNDAVGILVGVISLYLLWQQNQIFKKQNEIFAAQAGGQAARPERSDRGIFRRYWPIVTMALLMVITWGAVAVRYYGAHKTLSDLPEFDAPNSAVVRDYAQDSPSSCSMDVNGDALLSRQSGYKLAIACFIYDAKMDILDAPYLQVSNLYDINAGNIFMRAEFQPYFVEYRSQMHATGTDIALLNIPNGIQPSQFTTLRQARALGVKILALPAAKNRP